MIKSKKISGKKIIFFSDLDQPEIVDIKFAGDDFEFMYVLTKKNLYKLTGMNFIYFFFEYYTCTYYLISNWDNSRNLVRVFHLIYRPFIFVNLSRFGYFIFNKCLRFI